MFKFIPQPLQPNKKVSIAHWSGAWNGPTSDRDAAKKEQSPMPVIEPLFYYCAARHLVTFLTELPSLFTTAEE